MARPGREGRLLTPCFDLADSPPLAGGTTLLLTNLQHSLVALPHHPYANGCAHPQHHPQPALAPIQLRAVAGGGGLAAAGAPSSSGRTVRPAAPAKSHGAQRLNAQLQSVGSSGVLVNSGVLGPAGTGDSAAPTSSAADEAHWGRRLGSMVLRVGDMMQPNGECPGDSTWHERTANVLTSLPFLAVGWHMHRQRLTDDGKRHAVSMMVVGAAATLYHATWGRARSVARKLDYYSIAYCSSNMTKCLYADNRTARRVATLSLLAVPFRPFAVSLAHALVMQAEFARTAAQHKAVCKDLKRHYTAAALGLGAFFAEDLVANSGYGGFVHAAWHCLACYGVCTMNGLLAHKEREQLQRRLHPIKPLRRPIHSSASSLPSYGSSFQKLDSTADSWSSGTVSP